MRCSSFGVLERQLGALDAATTRLDEALALKRELGLKPGEAAALSALGAVALDRGAVADARRRFDEAARLASETDGRSARANAIAGRGEAAFEANDFAAAQADLEEALALRAELGRAGKVEETRLVLARVRLEAGEPRAALGEIDSLLADDRTFRPPALATQLALARARALAALGRSPEARRAFESIRSLAAESESPQTALQLDAASLALELAGVRVPALDQASAERAVLIARQRGFEKLALELEILRKRRDLRGPDGLAARTALRELAGSARAKGLSRLEQMAESAAGSG